MPETALRSPFSTSLSIEAIALGGYVGKVDCVGNAIWG
jgi:hypothetical protein